MTTPRSVLQRVGVEPREIRRIDHEFTNGHWRVGTGDGLVYLRRSVPERTLAEVEYEARVRCALSSRGWPVPRPVFDPIVVEGHVWCAFEAKPGRVRRPQGVDATLREQRERGRLLARFHADLRELGGLGQKPGWHRAEASFDLLDGFLARVAVTHPGEACEIRRYLERTRSQLADLRAEQQPAQIIHGELSVSHLLYNCGELSGVMDFDLAHANHRVADFAISWRGTHDHVVLGYDEVSPLEPIEWELLTPVYRAWYLMTAQARLAPGYARNPWFGYLIGNLSREPALPLQRTSR